MSFFMIMNVANQTNLNFYGYDAVYLKAFYMQGMRKPAEINIFREMKNIAQREGLDIFLNQDNTAFSNEIKKQNLSNIHLSIWGQDRKAFVLNKNGKTILWNTKEETMDANNINPFSDYQIVEQKYIPRGGNYYIGYKANGDKWLLINGMSISTKENFKNSGDKPTKEHLLELFDVKPENIYFLTDLSNDLDEIVRPIGYPYILVNDYKLSENNLEKMKEKFPNSDETYNAIMNYLRDGMQNADIGYNCDNVCKILMDYGFKPIRIGGRYCDDINYMNALALKNNRGGLSYITNSAKKSYPELNYLEQLFEKDLREKIPNITDIYFVSGGKRSERDRFLESDFATGLRFRNNIMDILSNRQGGIHCMTAEIPDFDRIINSGKTVDLLV